MGSRKEFVRDFLTCKHTLKSEEVMGVIPSPSDLYRRVVHIAWPAVLEAVLITLISMADTMMVGEVGPSAIAAVGITMQPRFLVLALLFSFNIGVTTVISRRKGANDYEGANQALRLCLLISSVAVIVLALLGWLLAEPLLRFAGAEHDYIDQSIVYFKIMMITTVFNGISLTINGAQRGVGNTKVAMKTNLTANIINVGCNYLLISGRFGFPRLEVKGAAIASAIGGFVGLCIAISAVCSKKGFLSLRCGLPFKMDVEGLRSVLKVTYSAMLEQFALRFGFFMYAKIIANLGTVAFATHQICMSFLALSFAFGDGFQITSASLVGQSLGAKRPDLAKLYIGISQRFGAFVATILAVLFILFRRQILQLFTDDPEIIAMGSVLVVLIAFTVHSQIGQVITAGGLRGAGDTRYTAIVSLISCGVIRPAVTFFLCEYFGVGLVGAWTVIIADQALRLVLSIHRFRSGKWQKIAL